MQQQPSLDVGSGSMMVLLVAEARVVLQRRAKPVLPLQQQCLLRMMALL